MNRTQPYAAEHRASLVRYESRPRNLLNWFLTSFRAELPERLHGAGVWSDETGGSALGSPKPTDGFRAFLETPPEAAVEQSRLTTDGVTVAEVSYRYPLRAALARVAGRGPENDPYPFMARTLFRVASMDGDWNAAAASMGIPEPVRWFYVSKALEHLWEHYRSDPPARPIARRRERVQPAAR